jgi:hypothetical protein
MVISGIELMGDILFLEYIDLGTLAVNDSRSNLTGCAR